MNPLHWWVHELSPDKSEWSRDDTPGQIDHEDHELSDFLHWPEQHCHPHEDSFEDQVQKSLLLH